MAGAVEMAEEGAVRGADGGPEVEDVVLLATAGGAVESEVDVGVEFEVEVAAAVGDSHILRSGVGAGGDEGLGGAVVIAGALVDDGAEIL